MTNAICAAGATLMLCGLLTGAALAQTAVGQRQDQGQNVGQQAPPVAEAGSTAQGDCLTDNGGFKRQGNSAVYTVELANKCEQRLKCRVYVNVSSAKGAAQGQATLILAPHSRGAAASKSYVLKVKMLGGMAQSSRECRVF
jgi:hypothetical protein